MTSPAPKAILCLDIDGTLIDTNEQVHPNDVRVLRHFPDEVQLILTTGRPLHSAKPILQRNSLFQCQKLPMPGVYLNGGAAYLPHEELCLKYPFSSATVQVLRELSFAYPKTEFVFFTVSEAYQTSQTTFGNQVVRLHYINSVGNIDNGGIDETIKVMALDDNPEVLKQIRNETKTLAAEMSFSLPYIYEFNPPGITKANTLQQLLQILRLEGVPIYATGDGENDLPLFHIAQRSFTPDTAHPAVIAQANRIISRKNKGLLEPILEQIL